MRYLLHDDFISSVATHGDKIAIQQECGNNVSYNELNALSNKFGYIFSNLKTSIKEYPFIGILSTVHINSIAAILGCLKIGCAYIPLDDLSPVERLKHIILNLNLDIIVIDPILYKKFKPLLEIPSIKYIVFINTVDNQIIQITPKTINFDIILISPSIELPVLNQVSDDLAYILHSSGSTGFPKGIMLTHRNARTFVDWMHKEFKVKETDIIMSRAPFKFDLSVFDIFNTFKAGGKLICYDWSVSRNQSIKHQCYVNLMEKEQATILYTTPSTYIALMNHGNLAKAKLNLRTIMYAGEPFPTSQLRKLKGILPNTEIANIYGPTETNIITCHWVEQIPNDESAIPLGFVVDDTEIMVVSEDQERICETNEIGELWCRGGTVTLGYAGLHEKTLENLVVSPFHPYPAKYWRTGDFGFKDNNGLLHYRGRRDHMVKVNGYRIELGEVESAIYNHAEVDEACVILHENNKTHNSLCCIYSTITKKTISYEAWRLFLKEYLPDYMIPQNFYYKESLPKTSSEKIDRVSLADYIHNLLMNEKKYFITMNGGYYEYN